jgi:hypothetical protein
MEIESCALALKCPIVTNPDIFRSNRRRRQAQQSRTTTPRFRTEVIIVLEDRPADNAIANNCFVSTIPIGEDEEDAPLSAQPQPTVRSQRSRFMGRRRRPAQRRLLHESVQEELLSDPCRRRARQAEEPVANMTFQRRQLSDNELDEIHHPGQPIENHPETSADRRQGQTTAISTEAPAGSPSADHSDHPVPPFCSHAQDMAQFLTQQGITLGAPIDESTPSASARIPEEIEVLSPSATEVIAPVDLPRPSPRRMVSDLTMQWELIPVEDDEEREEEEDYYFSSKDDYIDDDEQLQVFLQQMEAQQERAVGQLQKQSSERLMLEFVQQMQNQASSQSIHSKDLMKLLYEQYQVLQQLVGKPRALPSPTGSPHTIARRASPERAPSFRI